MQESKIYTFLKMAEVLSELSTCSRRKVGAIMVDSSWRIVGSGYNGNARRLVHCIDEPCKGAVYTSGTRLDLCEAIHAEQNALMQCPDTDKIHAIFVTTSPCVHCLKMLMNTSCKYIFFSKYYTDSWQSETLWTLDSNRKWIHIE